MNKKILLSGIVVTIIIISVFFLYADLEKTPCDDEYVKSKYLDQISEIIYENSVLHTEEYEKTRITASKMYESIENSLSDKQKQDIEERIDPLRQQAKMITSEKYDLSEEELKQLDNLQSQEKEILLEIGYPIDKIDDMLSRMDEEHEKINNHFAVVTLGLIEEKLVQMDAEIEPCWLKNNQ